MQIHYIDYPELLKGNIQVPVDETLELNDHLSGFTQDCNNVVLNYLSEYNYKNKITTQYIVTEQLKNKFFNLDLKFSPELQYKINLQHFEKYITPPSVPYKNFICSFNGSAHVSRKVLVSILKKFEYFNPEYCSKNFSFTTDMLDGHIQDYVVNDNFYRKFFIANNSEDFFQAKYSFGHNRFDHASNIYTLETKLTQSFLHIVSETMATSYVPFVTEKFLYSIVTQGLFLAYAQPGWHHQIEKYYGFKLYTKLFDYRFDSIENPIERLLELMTMISKFSKLTPIEWHDLYLSEQDTIEYNYNHYFSKNYLESLKQHG